MPRTATAYHNHLYYAFRLIVTEGVTTTGLLSGRGHNEELKPEGAESETRKALKGLWKEEYPSTHPTIGSPMSFP